MELNFKDYEVPATQAHDGLEPIGALELGQALTSMSGILFTIDYMREMDIREAEYANGGEKLTTTILHAFLAHQRLAKKLYVDNVRRANDGRLMLDAHWDLKEG